MADEAVADDRDRLQTFHLSLPIGIAELLRLLGSDPVISSPGVNQAAPFIESLLGKEVYVKLTRDWSVQGRLARIEATGLVLERVGIPSVFVRLELIGTIEEAQ